MKKALLVFLICIVLITASCNRYQRSVASTVSEASYSLFTSLEDDSEPPVSLLSPTSVNDSHNDQRPNDAVFQERIAFPSGNGSRRISKSIEHDGDDFTFMFSYYLYYEDETCRATNASVLLEIYNPDMEVVQIIEFESWNNWGHDSFVEVNVNEWKVVDINFDGYKDIICLKSIGGAKGNCLYLGWIWNPSTSVFEKTNIDDICNISIHASDRSLRSVSASSAGHQVYEIYRFIEGEFVLTNRLDFGTDQTVSSRVETECNYIEGRYVHDDYYPGEKWFVYELEHADGELMVVFPEFISDNEEGQAALLDRLYGNNSLWFGRNSPNFFASAYGDGISGSYIERDEELRNS